MEFSEFMRDEGYHIIPIASADQLVSALEPSSACEDCTSRRQVSVLRYWWRHDAACVKSERWPANAAVML